MSKTSYLVFYEITIPTKKTKDCNVYNSNNIYLGNIKWYSKWRQYCFFPEKDTIWSQSCLEDVQNKIKDLMGERLGNKRFGFCCECNGVHDGKTCETNHPLSYYID